MKTIKFLGTLVLMLVGGWVCAQEAYVVITPTPVNVYENSMADSKVIGVLQPKQTVEVYVVNGDWAIVKYNNGVGYVPGVCLKKADAAVQQLKKTPVGDPAKPAAPKVTETKKPAVTPADPQEQQAKKKLEPVSAPADVVQQPSKPLPPAYADNDFYKPYASYTLMSRKNNIANVLDCPSRMVLSLGYQSATLTDAAFSVVPDVRMPGGFFDFGGVFHLWGPLGLEATFGLSVDSKRLTVYEDERMDIDKTAYDKIARTRLDYRLNLAPVFWVNLNSDAALHFTFGPHWNLAFMDLQTYERNGERDFGPQLEYAGFEKGLPYRFWCTSWIAGVGFTYNAVGFRVSYQKDLKGRYKNPNVIHTSPLLYQRVDPRYQYLEVGMYFSFF